MLLTGERLPAQISSAGIAYTCSVKDSGPEFSRVVSGTMAFNRRYDFSDIHFDCKPGISTLTRKAVWRESVERFKQGYNKYRAETT